VDFRLDLDRVAVDFEFDEHAVEKVTRDSDL
jgi:hypothetical protein